MDDSVYLKTNCEYSKAEIVEFLENTSIFDEIIKRGDHVVIKPNWVKEHHLKKKDWDYIITHPVVIEATVEVVAKRLQGKGMIIITDGPQTDSSFEKIMQHMNMKEWYDISERYNIQLKIMDLRDEEWISKEGIILEKHKLEGDPKGAVEINLKGRNSEFASHEKSKRGYYGACNDRGETNWAHDGYNNIYRVSRTIIESDVFINIPKLKTHKKAGITCCLKNLVGINTYKNYLPHYCEGTPSEGGDQFPDSTLKNKVEGSLMASIKDRIKKSTILSQLFIPIKKIAKLIFGDTGYIVRSGNWYGNDTIWRMICDLNKILFYANSDSTMKEDIWINTKKYIGLVDGIKGGQGTGPLHPDPVDSQLLILGTNPVAIDCCCAKLMGFDYKKIPSISNAFKLKNYSIYMGKYENINVISKDKRYNKNLKDINKEDVLWFQPHFGWENHIELE